MNKAFIEAVKAANEPFNEDASVVSALEVIVRHAVKNARNDTTHHVHLRFFDELSLEDRKAVADELSWLAFDVLLSNSQGRHHPASIWNELVLEWLVPSDDDAV
jgi:hypothetical protein